MIRYFSGSISDIYNNSEVEATIIVPITDIGFIQDATIRNIAMASPEIWANVLTYCSGKNNGLISRHINNETNTQLVFISCLSTNTGTCTLERDIYLGMLEHIFNGTSRIGDFLDDVIPTYLIEPHIGSVGVFQQTIDDIAALCNSYKVGLNYVLPSTIL